MPEETAAKNYFLFSDVTHLENQHFGKALQTKKVKTSKILTYEPMYSPFSRESRGQKEARILCIRGVNLSEHRRVK